MINQRVHAMVEDLVEVEPLGELDLKGFLKQVSVFNVTALRSAAG